MFFLSSLEKIYHTIWRVSCICTVGKSVLCLTLCHIPEQTKDKWAGPWQCCLVIVKVCVMYTLHRNEYAVWNENNLGIWSCDKHNNICLILVWKPWIIFHKDFPYGHHKFITRHRSVTHFTDLRYLNKHVCSKYNYIWLCYNFVKR